MESQKTGAPGPKLVEPLGCNKTYPAQWKRANLDIAELARKRFIENWPRKRLVNHFNRSHNTITWWIGKLKKLKFRHEGIPLELQNKLKAVTKK
ncbi:MAG: hypothetical protein A4S09_17545 [Proteobacteria bacterium SG_bin7]|nr:MAG: hypothetical protein A4S09_17545 [Proteobacteria bacterium SG_bin7]